MRRRSAGKHAKRLSRPYILMLNSVSNTQTVAAPTSSPRGTQTPAAPAGRTLAPAEPKQTLAAPAGA